MSWQTGIAVFTWFVLNISISNIVKWTFVYGKLCTQDGQCQTYKFPLTITAIHMLFSWVLCWMYLRLTKGAPKARDVSWHLHKAVPLALCFACSVTFGNVALMYIYPSLSQMLSATGPIITVLMAVSLKGARYNNWTWVSMLIICGGLMLCSMLEINFHLLGAICIFAATTLRSLKSIIQCDLMADPADKLDAVSLLYYMAPHAGGMLIVVSLATEGLRPFTIFVTGSPTGTPYVIMLLILGGTNACLLNIANFVVTSYTSPVTLQVLGNVKSCFSIIISVLIFRNQLRLMQGLGVAVCLYGVHVYDKKGGAINHESENRPSVKAPRDAEGGNVDSSGSETRTLAAAVEPQQVPPPKQEGLSRESCNSDSDEDQHSLKI